MEISMRTVTAFLFIGAIAAGCGVQAKSERHAAGVCDSVNRLLKTKGSMDLLERKIQNTNRVVTSSDDLRRLSLAYRVAAAAYAELERNAETDIGKVDAGESTGTIERMWRQLTASLHERKVEMSYFADQFAHPKSPRTSAGEFSARNHHAFVQRANAKYAKMESVVEEGLKTLGFERRQGVFFIDC